MEHGAGWLRSAWKAQRRLWASVVKRLNGLPIIIFYRYLYENNKPLLAQGITVNYLLPMVLEILPFWWLSSRKLGNRLRKTRIKLNHNMVRSPPTSNYILFYTKPDLGRTPPPLMNGPNHSVRESTLHQRGPIFN
jgi:hypothetical protein